MDIKREKTERDSREPHNQHTFQSRVDKNGFSVVETNREFDLNKHYLQPLPARKIALYAENEAELEQNPGW